MVSVARDEGEEVTALLLQTIAATGIRVSELCHITVECLETGIADVYNKGKVRRILLPSELQKYYKNMYINKILYMDQSLKIENEIRWTDVRYGAA